MPGRPSPGPSGVAIRAARAHRRRSRAVRRGMTQRRNVARATRTGMGVHRPTVAEWRPLRWRGCFPTDDDSVPTCRSPTGWSKAVDRAAEIGATALQVFGDNPTAWRRRAAPSPELPAFRARLASSGHRTARDPRLLPDQPRRHRRGVPRAIRRRCSPASCGAAQRFGASIVNVHIGSHGATGAGGRDRAARDDDPPSARGRHEPERMARGRRRGGPGRRTPAAASRSSSRTRRAAASGSGWTWTSWPAIADGHAAMPGVARRADRLLPGHRARLGRRLSTWRTRERSTRCSTAFDRRIGLDRLRHGPPERLESELGSRLDRHEHLGAGRIGEAGLAHLLRHPRLAHAASILETPGMDEGYDAINLARAIALARGEPLAPLPPEALRRCAAVGRGRPRRPTRAGRATRPARARERRRRAGATRRGLAAAASARPASAILVVAAVLRLRDLADRGTWDADQGHDMLVLRALVLDGVVPLLGPPTSIGDFHHGVLYYSCSRRRLRCRRRGPARRHRVHRPGGDRRGRRHGVAGAVDRRARSPGSSRGSCWRSRRARSRSRPSSGTRTSSPCRARSRSRPRGGRGRRGRPRWWLVRRRGGGRDDALPRPRGDPDAGDRRAARGRSRPAAAARRSAAEPRRSAGAAVGWLVIALLSYVPLAIHELGSDGSELRAAVAFLVDGGGPRASALPARLPIVGLRVLGWPLAGLITAAPMATILAACLVIGLAIWRGWLRRAGGGDGASRADERAAVRWLALGLAVDDRRAGGRRVEPRDRRRGPAERPLPRLRRPDGRGARRCRGRRACRGDTPWPPLPQLAAAAIVVAIVGFNLAHQPPARAADGGWAAARSAAGRIATAAGGPARSRSRACRLQVGRRGRR